MHEHILFVRDSLLRSMEAEAETAGIAVEESMLETLS